MIRVLICDDEAPARAKLQRWLSERADFSLVGEAANGLIAAELIASLQPDVVLMDIQMPGLNGLEVAAQLDAEYAPLLVFVTAFDEHAVQAFELDAVDYLLKPYDKERLQRTLERVHDRLSSVAGTNSRLQAIHTAQQLTYRAGPLRRLLVPVAGRLQLIAVDTIHWLAADDNYVHVHVGEARYMLRRPLHELLAQLDSQQFVRIHKSTVVNLGEVVALEPLFKGDYELTLRSGITLRLSRRFKDEVLVLLGAR
jgi:two-component system, LytTR family, response regulator